MCVVQECFLGMELIKMDVPYLQGCICAKSQ